MDHNFLILISSWMNYKGHFAHKQHVLVGWFKQVILLHSGLIIKHGVDS